MALLANVSEVSICNLALAGLRATTIVDFSDNTQPEILSKLYYPIARDALLTQAPWSFATRRLKNLPALTATPEWGFTTAFQLPADNLKVWELSTGEDCPWRVEGDQILSDQDTISIRYTFRQTDPSKFTPTFVIALGKWLESLMAIPLTGKNERRVQAFEEAQIWIGEAASSDGQQGTPNIPVASDLETVRW